MEWLIPALILVALLVVVGIYLWAARNALIQLSERVDGAWDDIAAQLVRRAEIIPSLIDTVQHYATHEKSVVEKAAAARAEALRASTPSEAAAAEGHLQQAVSAIATVSDSYPQLQASADFLRIQQLLGETGNQIQASRRLYNGGVREYNAKIGVFPNTLFARRLGLSEREFFELSPGATFAEPPRIQF